MLSHIDCLYIIAHGLDSITKNRPNRFNKLISFDKSINRVVIATTKGSIDPNSIYIYRYENNLWVREWYQKLYLVNNKIQSVHLTNSDSIKIITTTTNLQYRLINDIWSLQQNMDKINV